MKLNKLKLNPDNPRIIKGDKFKKLVSSIKDFPKMMELRPIIVDKDNMILGGNMRHKALIEQGYKEIPDNWVKVADKLTDEEKKRFIVEDNLPFGEWDWDLLANQFDVDDLLEWGFDEKDLKIEKEVEEDEAPAVDDESEPDSKLGEVYQLGRHRLMCGDSTKIEDVEKLMDGNKADMVFTDPPYFIGLTSTGLNISQADKENVLHFFNAWFPNIKYFLKGHWYVCTDWRTYPVLYLPVVTTLGRMTNLIVWDFEWIKAGSQYRFTHEFIMFGDMENGKQVPRGEPDVWRLQAENFTQKRLHDAQKPVGLSVRAINNSSKQDDIVLDVFGGSGSTLIACEQTNRACYMMELDPKYCDVIRKRYAKFIDKEDEWQTITPIV